MSQAEAMWTLRYAPGPCDRQKWAWVRASGHYWKTWRTDPKTPLTDAMLRAWMDYDRTSEDWARCGREHADPASVEGKRRDMSALIVKRDTLYTRLMEGDAKISAGERVGQDVASWEGYWFGLLDEYRVVCDAIEAPQTLPIPDAVSPDTDGVDDTEVMDE